MSRYEFKLPDIGEGVTEGEIVQWHVKSGDQVSEDQPLVEVMTDKATVTITSPRKGLIVETRGNKGEVVAVHSVLVVYDLAGGAAAPSAPAPSAAPAPKKDEGPAATAVGDIKDVLPGMGAFVATVGVAPAPAPSAPAAPSAFSFEALRRGAPAAEPEYSAPNGKALATPATRKLARELGVDLAKVKPTGESGRVTKDDVRNFHLRRLQPAAPALPPAAPPSAFYAPPPASPPPPDPKVLEQFAAGSRAQGEEREFVQAPSQPAAPASPAPAVEGEERQPLRGLRRKIAEKMHHSKNTAAHFTFVEEVDCTALKELRERLKPKAAAQGVKLTFLPFIAKAVVGALKKFPTLNSSVDDARSEWVMKKNIHLGIAAASERGLIVPVVKNADRRSLLDLAREIERLGNDVRAGKSQLEDLKDSTFTITSLGQQGGLFATPIINHPEVAILGVHQMKQKPVVRGGQIVIGDVMLLSLSFDHRVIDGHVGAAFAYEVIGFLQDPDRLMLEL